MTLLVFPTRHTIQDQSTNGFYFDTGMPFPNIYIYIYVYNLCQLVGPSLKFEWNRLVSPRFEWTLKFERSPRIEGITLRSPRIECFTYFWGWSSTWPSQTFGPIQIPRNCAVNKTIEIPNSKTCSHKAHRDTRYLYIKELLWVL